MGPVQEAAGFVQQQERKVARLAAKQAWENPSLLLLGILLTRQLSGEPKRTWLPSNVLFSWPLYTHISLVLAHAFGVPSFGKGMACFSL